MSTTICVPYFLTFDSQILKPIATIADYNTMNSQVIPVLVTLSGCTNPQCTNVKPGFATVLLSPSGYTVNSNYVIQDMFQGTCWGRFFWAYNTQNPNEIPRVAMGWITAPVIVFGAPVNTLAGGPAYGASDLFNIKPALPDDVSA